MGKIKPPKVNRFQAGYDSDCNDCLGEILIGDTIGYVEDVVVCEACCDREDERVSRKWFD
jgi:hypothetical protein